MTSSDDIQENFAPHSFHTSVYCVPKQIHARVTNCLCICTISKRCCWMAFQIFFRNNYFDESWNENNSVRLKRILWGLYLLKWVEKSWLWTVYELRKSKWLSHGHPGYNFWLSVPVFGCPYLEQGKWVVEFYSWGMKSDGCPLDNHISIFGCPPTFLFVPGARTTKISNAGYE